MFLTSDINKKATALSSMLISNTLKLHDSPIFGFLMMYLFILMASNDSIKLEGSLLSKILETPYAHFLIILSVYYSFNKNLKTSLIVAAIIVSIMALFKIVEFMDSKLKLVEGSGSDIEPSCRNLKASDILNYFQNDLIKMRLVLRQSNIPDNININDHNAPFIGTRLYYLGHNITEKCKM